MSTGEQYSLSSPGIRMDAVPHFLCHTDAFGLRSISQQPPKPSLLKRRLTEKKIENTYNVIVNYLDLIICIGVEYHFIFPWMLKIPAAALWGPSRDLSVVLEWGTFPWYLPSCSLALICAYKNSIILKQWELATKSDNLTLKPQTTWEIDAGSLAISSSWCHKYPKIPKQNKPVLP